MNFKMHPKNVRKIKMLKSDISASFDEFTGDVETTVDGFAQQMDLLKSWIADKSAKIKLPNAFGGDSSYANEQQSRFKPNIPTFTIPSLQNLREQNRDESPPKNRENNLRRISGSMDERKFLGIGDNQIGSGAWTESLHPKSASGTTSPMQRSFDHLASLANTLSPFNSSRKTSDTSSCHTPTAFHHSRSDLISAHSDSVPSVERTDSSDVLSDEEQNNVSPLRLSPLPKSDRRFQQLCSTERNRSEPDLRRDAVFDSRHLARRGASSLTPGDNKIVIAPLARRRHAVLGTDEDTTNANMLPENRVSASNARPALSRMRYGSQQLIPLSMGTLYCSFEYDDTNYTLKLTISRAENLGGIWMCEQSVSSFVKVYINPAKAQKQCTDVVKSTRNPYYDTTLTFTSLTPDQLQELSITLIVYNKERFSLSRSERIGKALIRLGDYNIEDSCGVSFSLRLDLQKPDSDFEHKLGFLQISARYEPAEERIVITLLQAADLPKHYTSSGVYGSFEVIQPTFNDQFKQTKVHSWSTNPELMESFLFSVSSAAKDMAETAVIITIYSDDPLRKNAKIGSVNLGRSATDKKAVSFWYKIVQHPWKEARDWLPLQRTTE